MLAFRVTVAVYCTPSRKTGSFGVKRTVPLNWFVIVGIVNGGVLPGIGAGTCNERCVIVRFVRGNSAITTPEFAALFVEFAPLTLKKLAGTPAKVKSDLGVKVIVAVYTVFG